MSYSSSPIPFIDMLASRLGHFLSPYMAPEQTISYCFSLFHVCYDKEEVAKLREDLIINKISSDRMEVNKFIMWHLPRHYWPIDLI
jgi:hypothetical protein